MGQRRRALTPERSGLHLWGSELRAWRDRRRLSLAGLGDLIRYDPSYLGRLERAEQFPPEHLARACDGALDTAGELVRLWHLADRERRGICQPELGTVAGLLLSGGLFVFGRVDPGGSR